MDQIAAASAPAVLVVEDDAALVDLLRYNLEEQGFRVQAAGDGPEALERFAETPPRIVLLDWMLPTMSGIEVCRRLRGFPAGWGVPVIFLSARSAEQDIVCALEAGADDYVTKPYSFIALLARMQAVMRRVSPAAAPVSARLEHGDLLIDLGRHRVTRRGDLVHLTPTEYRLLQLLMARPGHVFSRDEVLDALWGRTINVEPRTLDAYIGRLRRAIGDDREPGMIRTVRGAGYTLVAA